MMVQHTETLPAKGDPPDADALDLAQEVAVAAVRARIGAHAVSVHWEAIVKLVGGCRTASEWRRGDPLPDHAVAVACVAQGWAA